MPWFGLPDLVLTGLPAGATAGIAVAGLVALTGLYLLKLQRRRVAVAFAPLWIALGGERRSQRWARRLRRWLSLLLQLIFMGLLLLAAADPRPATADRSGRSVVILIDRSASMGARDEDGPRLQRARQRADQLLDGLHAADRAMVVSFAADIVAHTGFEEDLARLHAGVAGLAAMGPSHEPGDLPRALAFARAVLGERPHPTLILISDGAFAADAAQSVRWEPAVSTGGARISLAGIDARFVAIGRRRDNLAILSFAARRAPADPTSVEAAVVVQSFRPAPATVTLEITAGADNLPVERLRLELQPGQIQRHRLVNVAAPDTLLTATLLPDDPGAALDDLGIDDRAFAVVPGLVRRRILRVGGGDLFLDGALLSLGDAVDVKRVAASAAEATRAAWPTYDAVIFDGVTPQPAPTAGRFLYLDPTGDGSPFPARGTVRNPIVSQSRTHHPLLRHLSLADVNIGQAHRLTLASDDVAVAAALADPLIAARARPGLRVVALAFDPRQSDLPMRSAFPLLLANSLAFLADSGGREANAGTSLRTGHAARLPAAEKLVAAAVTDPRGQTRPVAVRDGEIEIPVGEVGFYRVQEQQPDAGTRSLTLAANLADAVESDTAPAATLTLGGRALRPPDPPQPRRRHPFWMWALIAAAGLTLIEWASYHRRWTV